MSERIQKNELLTDRLDIKVTRKKPLILREHQKDFKNALQSF